MTTLESGYRLSNDIIPGIQDNIPDLSSTQSLEIGDSSVRMS